jgi:MFS family permease
LALGIIDSFGIDLSKAVQRLDDPGCSGRENSTVQEGVATIIPPPAAEMETPPKKGRAYTNYVLGLIMLANLLSAADRRVIAILIEPIKSEFHLSDSQIGFIAGTIFGLFYLFTGFPVARWVDVGVRRSIMSGALALWSAMTMLGGWATTAWLLALSRGGVALGEAACLPASHSMITDLVPTRRRAKAIAITMWGAALGSLLGLYGGGAINALYDWRTALVLVGMPGLILALLFQFTVREPSRAERPSEVKAEGSVWQIVKYLMKLRSFRYAMLGCSCLSIVLQGWGNWAPSLVIRIFGQDTAQAGLWVGIATSIGSVLGFVLSGVITHQLIRRDERWYVWIGVWSAGISIPLAIGFAMLPSLVWAYASLALLSLVLNVFLPTIYDWGQYIATPRMRGTIVMVIGVFLNFFGGLFGVPILGAFNDWLTPTFGVEAIRYGMAMSAGFLVIGILLLLLAARYLRQDMATTGERLE